MKLNICHLALFVFLFSCSGKQDPKALEGSYYKDHPEMKPLEEMAPSGEATTLRKPPQAQPAKLPNVLPKPEAGRWFMLTQSDQPMRGPLDAEVTVEDANDTLVRFSKNLQLGLQLPRIVKHGFIKGDVRNLSYRQKFFGLMMESVRISSKEGPHLGIVHEGGDMPVAVDEGAFSVKQLGEEKQSFDSPSETIYNTLVEVRAGSKVMKVGANAKPLALDTPQGKIMLLIVKSIHTTPKDVGSSFEAPLYELEYVLTRAQ